MKTIAIVFAIVFAMLGAVATAAPAQQGQHEQSAGKQGTPATEAAKPGMSGPEIKSEMSNEMSKMMSGKMQMGRGETTKLMDQVMESFAAIDAEKDRKALQRKLAEARGFAQATAGQSECTSA